MLFLSLALILMLITMTLVGAYLRRNEYEDYDIKLSDMRVLLPMAPETLNLYRLNGFFENQQGMGSISFVREKKNFDI